MASVISNVNQSKCKITYDRNRGVDLDFGQRIIFEYKETLYMGYCQGWKLVDGKPVIKTDMLSDSYSRLDLPIDKVWRIRDRRDDIIEEIARIADVGNLFDGQDHLNEYTHKENEELLEGALDRIYAIAMGKIELEEL